MFTLIEKSKHTAFRDLSGMRFERLLVVGPVAKKWRNYVWGCVCDCGAEVQVKSGELVSGNSKSCGCYKADNTRRIMTTHGHTGGRYRGKGSRAYRIWCEVKTRTSNEKRETSHRYVGRGITVCERWQNSFEAFLQDMGEPPAGMSIERMDNDGPYCKENCRWATMREQAANTSRSRHLTLNGERMIVTEASRRYGVSQYTIYKRLNRGCSDHDAVFGEKSRSRHITVNGERMIVTEAEKRFNVSRYTIYSRLDRGMSDREAVFGAAN